ncbi:MAG: spore coat associated protein CotJA [Bacillota bacterium]
MFRDEKNAEQAKAQAAPMDPLVGQTGMPYPGHPGMMPPPYPTMPGTQPGYFPGMLPLAQGYFPIQQFGPVFDYAKALEVGTLFPDLWRPYPNPHQ